MEKDTILKIIGAAAVLGVIAGAIVWFFGRDN